MELKNDTESITVYRNLNAEEQLWSFTSPHDNKPYDILFGGVVLEFLNALRNILNESEEQSPFDTETVGFLKHNSRYWEGRYYELIDSILAKKSLELTNLYMLYEKYKGFALEITDYQYIVASDGTSNEYRKNIETEITFKGYEILKNKQKYEKYEVFTMPNGAYLFSLDLWNIFFHENMKLQFKCCAYCNDFIKIKHRNQKYCSVCKEIVNSKNKKKSNEKQIADVIKYMKKRIMTRFSTSQAYAREAEEKISDFLLETGYIEARLMGEDRPYNPNYNNTIETLDQYREWLIAYEEKTRIYKKSDK